MWQIVQEPVFSSSCPANITRLFSTALTDALPRIVMKFPITRYERDKDVSVCMEISKLLKSQSLVIIFAAASSLAAKPQNSTSEGDSPPEKNNHEASTIRKYGSRAQQSLWVSIGQHLSSTATTHSFHFSFHLPLFCCV